MMNRIISCGLFVGLIAAGCADISADQTQQAIGQDGEEAVEQKTTFLDFASGGQVGKIEIERTADFINVELESTATPGHVVTLWSCGVNNPGACADGPANCSIDDMLNNADAEGFCYWGNAGGIADEDGEIEIFATVPVGEQPGDVLFGDPIADGFASTLFFFLHEHGEPIDALLEEQLTTFTGGCPPNECVTTQVSFLHAVE